jgi:tetrahydromethanopterin S-methyltransferase subunit C
VGYGVLLPTFDTRDNKRVLTNQKLYSTIFKISQVVLTNQKLYSIIFKISQVVADPFIALAFILSPFGIKHQNGINLGP